MWQKFLSFFSGVKFGPAVDAIKLLAPVLEHLEAKYVQDQDAKNALIDTLVEILQEHKNQPKA